MSGATAQMHGVTGQVNGVTGQVNGVTGQVNGVTGQGVRMSLQSLPTGVSDKARKLCSRQFHTMADA